MSFSVEVFPVVVEAWDESEMSILLLELENFLLDLININERKNSKPPDDEQEIDEEQAPENNLHPDL